MLSYSLSDWLPVDLKVVNFFVSVNSKSTFINQIIIFIILMSLSVAETFEKVKFLIFS